MCVLFYVHNGNMLPGARDARLPPLCAVVQYDLSLCLRSQNSDTATAAQAQGPRLSVRTYRVFRYPSVASDDLVIPTNTASTAVCDITDTRFPAVLVPTKIICLLN